MATLANSTGDVEFFHAVQAADRGDRSRLIELLRSGAPRSASDLDTLAGLIAGDLRPNGGTV